MSNLVAILFDDEETAFSARADLSRLQKEYLIDMEDVVVVTKNEKGKVKLHQSLNLTAMGAVGGSFWGMLIGMLFLNPLVGMAAGAGAGAVSGALTDIGIDNKMMKEVGESFKPNNSALFLLVRSANSDKVLKEMESYSGKATVLQTSLSSDDEESLRKALEKMS